MQMGRRPKRPSREVEGKGRKEELSNAGLRKLR